MEADLSIKIADHIRDLYPGASEVRVQAFAVDEGSDDSTKKGIGYGKPVLVSFVDGDLASRTAVLHTASSDDFGHDRRSDRAGEILEAFDSFGDIPHHVRSLDVGFVLPDGALRTARDGGEFYLLTQYAPGTVYADDLRDIARRKRALPRDRVRCDLLTDCLVEIHSEKISQPKQYTRAIRDLIGHGDGIFGLVDDFASDVPFAPPARLKAIERRCQDWRWRLRGFEHRLCRTHGDFHPFNILFDADDDLALLDASRGCRGDPADDVVCLTLNYVFFAIGHPGAWAGGLGELWRRSWTRYLDRTGDHEILSVAPPYVAWRALVMADPTWYPEVTPDSRDVLLKLVEAALEQGRFELDSVDDLFK